MKKLALVFLAGISFASAHAQFQFGVKAGANFSSVNGSGTDGVSTSSLTGFNGGVYFKLPVAPHVSIQPELVYSGEGFKVSESGVTATQHENYFNIPVLLNVHFSLISLETGPQFGFLISANEKVQGVSDDNKSAFNSSEFAWVFGAAFKIPTTHLSVDARYNLGISNIANNGSNNTSNNSSNTIHNGVFQIGLMYTLFSAPVR